MAKKTWEAIEKEFMEGMTLTGESRMGRKFYSNDKTGLRSLLRHAIESYAEAVEPEPNLCRDEDASLKAEFWQKGENK